MVLTGYKLSGITNLTEITEQIQKIQRSVQKIRTKEYHQLLGEEIAFLCDNLTLNVLRRDHGEDIFEIAVNNLNNRMMNAGRNNVPSKYNLNIYLNIMTLRDDTYIKVLCLNPKLLKAFKGFEEYHLNSQECQDDGNGKNIVWQELHAIYSKMPPMSMNLSSEIPIDREKIRYPEKNERCQRIARQQLTSHYLNQISGGTQIPPHLLMQYMDEAMELLMTEDSRVELSHKTLQLQNILLDLNKDDSIVYGENTTEKGEQ